MAENTGSTIDQLKTELETMRSQLANMLKTAEDKKSEITSDMVSRLARELAHYRHEAAHKADQLRDAGQAGLEEVGEQVRRNPLASVAIAFGAGWVLSCLFRRIR